VSGSARWLALLNLGLFATTCSEPQEHRAAARLESSLRVFEAPLTPLSSDGHSVPQMYLPALGWLGSSYIVAFVDRRDGVSSIYATRATAALASLDGRGNLLFEDNRDSDGVHLACAQQSCLAAWDHLGPAPNDGTYAMRVGPLATSLDPQPLVLNGSGPLVASDGRDFVVLSSLNDGGTRFSSITRVTAAGTVLDALGVPIGPGAASPVAIAFTGDRYLISLVDPGGAILGTWFDLDGGVGPVFPVSQSVSGCYDGTLAWSQGEALFAFGCAPVVWENAYGARWTPDAGILDTPPFLISDASVNLDTDLFGYASAAVPQGFFVGWTYATGRPHAAGARIARDGTLVDLHELPFNPSAMSPKLEYDLTFANDPTGGVVVLWDEDIFPYGVGIEGVHLSWDSGVADPTFSTVPPDPAGPADQLRPALACTPSLCLAVWFQPYLGFRAARIAHDGGALDPAGFSVAPAPPFPGSSLPLVVALDTDFIVSWVDRASVQLYRVNADAGVEAATAPALDAGAAGGVAGIGAAWDGQTLWAVWYPSINNANDDLDLYEVQLDAGLAARYVRTLAANAGVNVTPEHVLFSQGQVLVEWSRFGTPQLVRFDTSGALLGPGAVALPAGSGTRVASADPLGWVVVTTGPSQALRVWLDGGVDVGGALPFTLPAALPGAMTLAFDGRRHLLTWIDQTRSPRWQQMALYLNVDLDAGAPFVVPTGGNPQSTAAAGLGPGSELFVYSRYDATLDSQRVFELIVEDVDAGVTPDAGGVDAGLADAGTADGGPGVDAGLSDAGGADGGADAGPGTTASLNVACGCAQTPAPGALALLLLVMSAWPRRTRWTPSSCRAAPAARPRTPSRRSAP
jgi:hypothetical protein